LSPKFAIFSIQSRSSKIFRFHRRRQVAPPALPRRRHWVVPLPLEQSVELHSSAWMSPASSSLTRPPPPPFSIGGPCHKATPLSPCTFSCYYAPPSPYTATVSLEESRPHGTSWLPTGPRFFFAKLQRWTDRIYDPLILDLDIDLPGLAAF
jgi:hypothetical protein